MYNNWIQDIIRRISNTLLKTEHKRLDDAEQQLIKNNTEAGGSADGFTYQGISYSSLIPALRAKGTYTPLDPTLYSVMDKILADRQNTVFDQVRIQQAFALSLIHCTTRQDVFDALPNSVMEILLTLDNDFVGYRRTRPEAYTLADNPRAQRQYAKLREKIEFYTAARMLY